MANQASTDQARLNSTVTSARPPSAPVTSRLYHLPARGWLSILCALWACWVIYMLYGVPISGYLQNTRDDDGKTDARSRSRGSADPCEGKYIYMYTLPAMFNQELVATCNTSTRRWYDMCNVVSNGGLGPQVRDEYGDTLGEAEPGLWFATDHCILDMVFHHRMRRYRCLTSKWKRATLMYLPFYAGIDITTNLFGASAAQKDRLGIALADWLSRQPQWRASGGRNHFMVTGKISCDFRREPEAPGDAWGSNFLFLPALHNMMVLGVEGTGGPASSRELAIPYPTYFHPTEDRHVLAWQAHVRSASRPHLFSFIGARRPELAATNIRGELIDLCANSSRCHLVECHRGMPNTACTSPLTVLHVSQRSTFCLQPPGDSYTRRAFFDSMLSGCIPVVFHIGTAYSQYIWHLPPDSSSFSMLIPEEDVKYGRVDIENILLQVSPAQVQLMRENIIALIPGLIYAQPHHRLRQFKDAFDITIESLLNTVLPSSDGTTVLLSLPRAETPCG